MTAKTKIIGIDPGKTGAIVMLDGDTVRKYPIPLIGKELDMLQLHRILDVEGKQDWHVFIEDVHAIYGSAAGSTFTFGFVCGAIQAMVIALKLKHTLVQPKEWQKVVYQGIPVIRKPSIIVKKGKLKGQRRKGPKDCKAMSELAAKRLFPTVDLRKNDRCKVSHDGIVDALLIAEYGKRTLHATGGCQ